MSEPPPAAEKVVPLADLPLELLNELDRSINAIKWTVPIKSEGALPVLLTHAITLAKQGSAHYYSIKC